MIKHYIEKTDDGYEIKKIYDVLSDGSIRYTEEALEKMKATNFYPARCSGRIIITLIEKMINKG